MAVNGHELVELAYPDTSKGAATVWIVEMGPRGRYRPYKIAVVGPLREFGPDDGEGYDPGWCYGWNILGSQELLEQTQAFPTRAAAQIVADAENEALDIKRKNRLTGNW
jgi:hypothetical protein